MTSPRVARRLDAGSSALSTVLDRARAYATLPLAWAYRASDQQDVIDADVRRWLEVFQSTDDEHSLHSLLFAFEEFRGVFYYRLSRGNATGALLARVLRHIWRPVASLELATPDIGPGLFVAHGHSTTLAAERIGANCYVHQGVTIGWDYRSERAPIIEDDVFIGAGAVIVGAVTIGKGARIGSNAVVLCDVPPGATAAGVPARVFDGPGEVVSLRREESAGS
ncbi:MAG: DapH/DapD/GlmU-related protein [Acidimicrobiales bacterium]|jgi:serine O-acetyltransferase